MTPEQKLEEVRRWEQEYGCDAPEWLALRAILRERGPRMTPWTDGPTEEFDRYYWWREKQASEPVIVKVVKSYDRLLAGPWAGGLKPPAEMAGWWLAVEVPR